MLVKWICCLKLGCYIFIFLFIFVYLFFFWNKNVIVFIFLLNLLKNVDNIFLDNGLFLELNFFFCFFCEIVLGVIYREVI